MDFDYSGLDEPLRSRAIATVAKCDYPFNTLATPYAGRIIFRQAQLQTFASWSDQGYININYDTAGHKSLESYIIHELGHAVDKLGLTDQDRDLIRKLFHDGNPCTHPWLQERQTEDYEERVGEAWANLFVRAYSPFAPPALPFVHYHSLDKARFIRSVLTPDLAVPPHLASPKRNPYVIELVQSGGVVREKKLGPLTDDLSVKVLSAKNKGNRIVVR